MAVSLSSMAAVLRPSGAHRKKKKAAKASEAAAQLREWLPIAPKGSWERVSELVSNAARRCADFGGNSEQPCWFISIWASYPEKNAVVIANTDSGKLWLARYEIDDEDGETVTFPVVKNAQSSVTVTEALKKIRESRRGTTRVREGAAPVARLKESVKFDVRIREVKADENGASATCVMLEEGPGNAVDGHYYTADCFESAAAVFEGAKSFADHADEIEERIQPGRSIRDMIGWWSDVHVEEAADGHKLLIGTYNIESGNAFALNKMREAKRYATRYADQPEKQYVGFSISAGGISESREIAGKTYNAVLRITEAGSTDMVTAAGAGGKMLSLQEAQRMAKTAQTGARQTAQLAEIDPKKFAADVLSEAGITLDDEDMESFVGALGDKLKKKPADANADPADEAAADDEDDIAGDDVDDVDDDGGDDADDINDVLDDKRPVEGKRNESARRTATSGTRVRESGRSGGSEATKLREQLDAANAENAKLKERQKFQETKALARRIVRELKVPVTAQPWVLGELLDVSGGEKAMRERATALLDGVIRPLHGDGVAGVPARARESASTGLLNVSGIAE